MLSREYWFFMYLTISFLKLWETLLRSNWAFCSNSILQKHYNLIATWIWTKFIFSFCLASMSWWHLQFTLETQEGDPIVDGQTVTLWDLGWNQCLSHFYVNNESTTDEIYMKVEFVVPLTTMVPTCKFALGCVMTSYCWCFLSSRTGCGNHPAWTAPGFCWG